MGSSPFYPILLVSSLISFASRPSLAELGLHFSRSPEPIVAPFGDEVVFECSLNVPAELVRWRLNGEYLSHEHDHQPNGKPTATSRHMVKFYEEKQEGDYQCVAQFGASALASTPARLTLAKILPFSYLPSREYVVTAGNSVNINCPPPESKPPAVIQYYHNNQPLPESVTILPNTGTLLLTNVTKENSGVYTCTANNYITGQVINSQLKLTLNVVPPIQDISPKFLYDLPSKYVVQAGQNVSLECSGVGHPPPKVSWRKVNGVLPYTRIEYTVGTLKLNDVRLDDSGQYLCELSNRAPPMVAHSISLVVQVPPTLKKGPSDAVVEEETDTELSCEAEGSPPPNITWVLNGESIDNDSQITSVGGKLIIKRIQKSHAGIYQCFISNPVGVTYGAGMIQVSPIPITAASGMGYPSDFDDDDDDSLMTPAVPSRNGHKKDHPRKVKGGRKKDKKHRGNSMMIPPSRPNITRLSDRSVMVRWSVPNNTGLAIQFFKVQYQDLDASGKSSRWMTSNEDIQPHIRSYEVDSLTTDHHYRFRIAAVYTNNDNKLGKNSMKFHLQRGPPQNRPQLFPPRLVNTEPVSPTAIKIHWEYLNAALAPVDGFYVYYRSTSSAGDYVKATVEGVNKREYVITHLLPDTSYDIKLQSFTVRGASDFSKILSQKTFREPNATVAPLPEVVGGVTGLGVGESSSHGQLYLVLGAVIAGLTLLLTLAISICICYRRSVASDDSDGVDGCDKNVGVEPGLTIQQLDPVNINGFAHNGKVNGRGVVNGFLPRPMNITNNPLADSEQDKNVMELSYMTSQNNNCSAEGRSELQEELEIGRRKRKDSWSGARISRTGENYV